MTVVAVFSSSSQRRFSAVPCTASSAGELVKSWVVKSVVLSLAIKRKLRQLCHACSMQDCCRTVVGKSGAANQPWQRIEPVAAEDVHFLICYAVTSGKEALAAGARKLSPFTKHVVQVTICSHAGLPSLGCFDCQPCSGQPSPAHSQGFVELEGTAVDQERIRSTAVALRWH